MKNKKVLIAIIALVVVIASLLGIYFATRPEAKSGRKAITITVVYEDGSSKDFYYTTREEYLGPVLLSDGLVEGEMGPYGLYIEKVDGVAAIWEENGAYWSVYVGEEPAVTGADEIPIEDGGVYKLVYMLG